MFEVHLYFLKYLKGILPKNKKKLLQLEILENIITYKI